MSTRRTLASSGWVDAKQLPRGPNGRALCRYCANEVPAGRRTFCGGAQASFVYRDGRYITPGHGCVHEHCLRSDPGYARKCVWARDQGKCELCPATSSHRGASHEWQADHRVPVVEGGGACGLENLRTLCTACHRLETAKLAARRASARKVAHGEA